MGTLENTEQTNSLQDECDKTENMEKVAEDVKNELDLTEDQRDVILQELTENIVIITAKCVGRELIPQEGFDAECNEKEIAEKILKIILDSGREGIEQLKDIVKEVEMNRSVDILESVLEEKRQNLESKEETISQEQEETIEIPEPEPKKELWPYRKVIEDGAGTLIDCLQIQPRLLRILEKNSVLSNEMVSNIMCRANRPDQAKSLIGYLMELGPESLTAFVEALKETEQHFMANILSTRDFY